MGCRRRWAGRREDRCSRGNVAAEVDTDVEGDEAFVEQTLLSPSLVMEERETRVAQPQEDREVDKCLEVGVTNPAYRLLHIPKEDSIASCSPSDSPHRVGDLRLNSKSAVTTSRDSQKAEYMAISGK